MLDSVYEWGLASVISMACLLAVQAVMATNWRNLGTSFNILWLFNYPAGMKFPPPEEEIKGKSFLEVSDIGVKRMHDATIGLGLPNSFLYWHWGMVGAYLVLFTSIFWSTTSLVDGIPYLTLVHKLVIFFNLWESLGLGVLHGPLHGKMGPPFTDWWYRLTPGTMKYNAPFMPFLPNTRNLLDVFVEGPLTYVLTFRCLVAQTITPELMLPLMLCSLYEFFFDYGQHLHDYGTQNLHFFVCMCFSVEQGQLLGIQLFLSWFYFSSGFCKLGPTFQYMFTSNLLAAKFMVDVPWGEAFRKIMFRGHDKDDYRLTNTAYYMATFAAVVEMTVPLLTWSNNVYLVWTSIAVMLGMHAFIISTLVIDVFAWNFTDAMWYVVLFGIVSTGVDWASLDTMSPILACYLLAHFAYSASGHFFPLSVPYVVAHRHAAGNWSQGCLVIKKTAAAKLAKLKSHAGLPGQNPGWQGEWFAFHMVWAYFWNFNVQNKVLPGLVSEVMGKGSPSDGMFHSTGDYILLHSVLFMDALIAHVRFDGLSSVALMPELAKVCGFEEGECTLCWAGPFATFVQPGTNTARWMIVDSATGTLKEGDYTMADIDQAKPSDCGKIQALVRAAPAFKSKSA